MWETIINLFMYHSVYYIYISFFILIFIVFLLLLTIIDYVSLHIYGLGDQRIWAHPGCLLSTLFVEKDWNFERTAGAARVESIGQSNSMETHALSLVLVRAPKPQRSQRKTRTQIYIYMCVCMYTPCIYTSIYRYCMNLACFCLSGAKRASDLCALQFWAILGDRPT